MKKSQSIVRLLTVATAMVAVSASGIAPAFAGGGDAPMPAQMMEPPPSPPAEATPAPMAEMSGGDLSTLSHAVNVGVNTHPRYGIVANNRRATDEELRQAKALYYPSIDARADYGFEYTDDVQTRAGIGDDTESLTRYDAGITLTQMLFDGFETKYENERQKHRVDSASHRVRETSEFLGLDIVEAYLDVIRQRQLLGIARENIASHTDILNQINDASTAGRSTQADVEQSRSRLAAARAQEASVLQALREAEANFINVVGEAPGDLQVPGVPGNALAANVDEEVRSALTTNPTLDIRSADIDTAQSEIGATGSTFYPQLDLQLNGRQGDDLGGIIGKDKSASALVVANWNLFRGGADVARKREFIYRKAQASEERANTVRAIESDVRQTWAQMVAAGERAKQFQEQAAANQQVVGAYMDQFELDRRTLLDVLDSQNEWFVSRSNQINNEVLQMFAVYRLLALKGKLLPSLNVAYPAEADPKNFNVKKEKTS